MAPLPVDSTVSPSPLADYRSDRSADATLDPLDGPTWSLSVPTLRRTPDDAEITVPGPVEQTLVKLPRQAATASAAPQPQQPQPAEAAPSTRRDPVDQHSTRCYTPAATSGKLIAGKYRLRELIASGGMGAVWSARHEQLGVDVALKLLHEAFAESEPMRRRFEREAQQTARVSSPHVVQVRDYGIEGRRMYIAMEMLDGEDLEARLKRQRCLPLPEVVAIVRQVARGVARVHEAGIVHRDLKPSNVFLCREDGRVKLLDFGIAKSPALAQSCDETSIGSVVGSPYYMSPEQLRGGQADARSDVWAVGVIAYRMLTGRLPFSATNFGGVALAVLNQPCLAPSNARPGLDETVDALFDRALCKDPAGRFQSADELAAAFEALLEGGVDERVAPSSPRPPVSSPLGTLTASSFTAPLPLAPAPAADESVEIDLSALAACADFGRNATAKPAVAPSPAAPEPERPSDAPLVLSMRPLRAVEPALERRREEAARASYARRVAQWFVIGAAFTASLLASAGVISLGSRSATAAAEAAPAAAPPLAAAPVAPELPEALPAPQGEATGPSATVEPAASAKSPAQPPAAKPAPARVPAAHRPRKLSPRIKTVL